MKNTYKLFVENLKGRELGTISGNIKAHSGDI
jgi:hypothetical protein